MSTTTNTNEVPAGAAPVTPEYSPAHAVKTRWLILFGLIGFTIGVLIMFWPSSKYHDFVFRPKKIADTLLAMKANQLFDTRPSDSLILLAKSVRRKINQYDATDTSPDSDLYPKPPKRYATLKTRMQFDSILLYTRLENERHRIADLVDTSFSGRYLVGSLFTTDKSKIADLLEDTLMTAAARTFHFRYDRDTAAPELCIRAEHDITIDTTIYSANDIQFFKKYPSFGTFTVVTIFQFVAFFIIIPIGLFTIRQLRDEWKNCSSKTPMKVFNGILVWDFSISFGVVAAFAVLIYLFIVTPGFIGNNYFRSDFTHIVWIYYILAYLAAIICYAGFLFTARILADMLLDFQSKAKTQKRNLIANNKPEVASGDTDLTYLTDRFQKVHKHFNIFFFTSAFLLSMTIVGSGSLFSAINSLDIVKFLEAPPSHPLLRNDFIYLLGGVYSILLLLFYIPVKISMSNLINEIPDLKKVTADDANTGSLLPVFSTGLRTTLGVLAASSPFLVSILGSILSSFGGGH